MDERYDHTLRKEAWLRANGYRLSTIWECEWNAEKKRDAAIAEFVRDLNLITPLNPREALYGGRTNAMKLFHTAGEGEKMAYADVVSPYPYICKTGTFPLGHPTVYQGAEIPQGLKVVGLIKCKILPPWGVFHPVLPYRVNKLGDHGSQAHLDLSNGEVHFVNIYLYKLLAKYLSPGRVVG